MNKTIKHSKGYRLVKYPDHHRADCRGYVFEHILIMEKALGRHLVEEECIHHLDGNPANNDSTNLLLCENNAHHKKIHLAEKAYRECGHAEWRKCSICKQYDSLANLYINPKGKGIRHRECWKKFYTENKDHFNQLQRIRREKAGQNV